jgi:hypothetical protein
LRSSEKPNRKRSFEMKKSRYNEEQIIGVLKRMEAGQKARDLV